jgi:hypothetical protein
MLLYLPFMIKSGARYVFFGNENSCDKEAPHGGVPNELLLRPEQQVDYADG